ncbi:MAG: hypothetical protein N2746_02835 [Deltaproteobacteria bacterium]|nr:hypothetical protein [Deltaproteobacteria bacterium]
MDTRIGMSAIFLIIAKFFLNLKENKRRDGIMKNAVYFDNIDKPRKIPENMLNKYLSDCIVLSVKYIYVDMKKIRGVSGVVIMVPVRKIGDSITISKPVYIELSLFQINLIDFPTNANKIKAKIIFIPLISKFPSNSTLDNLIM